MNDLMENFTYRDIVTNFIGGIIAWLFFFIANDGLPCWIKCFLPNEGINEWILTLIAISVVYVTGILIRSVVSFSQMIQEKFLLEKSFKKGRCKWNCCFFLFLHFLWHKKYFFEDYDTNLELKNAEDKSEYKKKNDTFDIYMKGSTRLLAIAELMESILVSSVMAIVICIFKGACSCKLFFFIVIAAAAWVQSFSCWRDYVKRKLDSINEIKSVKKDPKDKTNERSM